MEDRLFLFRQYLNLQVFNAIAINWVKHMIVPTIFSVSGGIVLCLYVSIRHTELPTLTYLLFPYVALSMSVLIFWICFEVVKVIHASEVIVETLGTVKPQDRSRMTEKERLYIRKRARATRVLYFQMGEFMDFSLDVPVGIWDEIINQLLFLLTY